MSVEMNAAASEGDLELIKDLHLQGHPWDEETYYEAATSGHIHIMKYLNYNECPWRKNLGGLCEDVAIEGHLNALKYLVYLGCPIEDPDNNLYECLAENNRLDIMKYLYYECQLCIEDDTIENIMFSAASEDYVDIVQWLHEYLGYEFSEEVCDIATKCECTKVIDYIQHVKNRDS